MSACFYTIISTKTIFVDPNKRSCSSLNVFYKRVSDVTKQILYQFINDNTISLLNYNFNLFFQHYIKKNKIQVIGHHFTNHKIEGLTIIDEHGISFSYEKDNPKAKQNFTLCHELGHFILNHSGTCFTESVDNKENILEREANIFSAVVLMPDIVLLSKIYYSCDTFEQVKNSLKVSKQALYYRLLDLLREYFFNMEYQIKSAVEKYMNGQNAALLILLYEIKENIIKEFNEYKPSIVNQIKKRMSKVNFVTSQDFPELLDRKQWDKIQNNETSFKIWSVYNKGKSITYVWDDKKLSASEARKKAELQLLLM